MADESTRGPIVINGATSGMSERLAIDAGVASHRSAVGEANVADMMIANKATYGGEGNGGPIDPRVGYVRDSFVGMAQVLDLMTTTGRVARPVGRCLAEAAYSQVESNRFGRSIAGSVRCVEERTSRRHDSDRRRLAIGMAGQMAVGARQQHRTNRSSDRRSRNRSRSKVTVRLSSEIVVEPRRRCGNTPSLPPPA